MIVLAVLLVAMVAAILLSYSEEKFYHYAHCVVRTVTADETKGFEYIVEAEEGFWLVLHDKTYRQPGDSVHAVLVDEGWEIR